MFFVPAFVLAVVFVPAIAVMVPMMVVLETPVRTSPVATVVAVGTEATGRVRRMLARSGSFHTMERAATTVAIGEVRAGVSSTTITGTMTAIGTTVAGTKTTASTKAGTKKIVTTTIATKKLN